MIFTMSLSPGNRVHSHEDSRRCELPFADGWTAGQALSEDGSPGGELRVSRGILGGEGLVCKISSTPCAPSSACTESVPHTLLNCRKITRFCCKNVLYFFYLDQ